MTPTTSVNTKLWNALLLVRAAQARVYELDTSCQIEKAAGDQLEPSEELTRLLSRAVDDIGDVAVVLQRLPEGALDKAAELLETERAAIRADEALTKLTVVTLIEPAAAATRREGGAA